MDPAGLRRGSLVHYAGERFTATGLVAYLAIRTAVIIDGTGRLYRAPRCDLTVIEADQKPAQALVRRAVSLLNRSAVREAIAYANDAPDDPHNLDVWNFPLGELTVPNRPLRPLLRRYHSWPAITRRCFEKSLGILLEDGDTQSQWAAVYWTLLGSLTDSELATRRGGVTPAAVRMARMRGKRCLVRYVGASLINTACETRSA